VPWFDVPTLLDRGPLVVVEDEEFNSAGHRANLLVKVHDTGFYAA
jgi:hypothetical protein